MYICIYVYMYICTYVCIHVYIYMYKYACMYVYMYVYILVCLAVDPLILCPISHCKTLWQRYPLFEFLIYMYVFLSATYYLI